MVGIGLGILYTGTQFAVLAPLSPRQQPHAIAFFGFVRALGQVFGISIGTTALQNQLNKKLPAVFIAEIGGSAEAAFAAIPRISSLYVPSLSNSCTRSLLNIRPSNRPERTRTAVRAAFADSAQVLWIIGCAMAGVALLLCLFLEDLKLATTGDEDWGLKEKSTVKAASPQGIEEKKVGAAA